VQKCGGNIAGAKILSTPWFRQCGGERPHRSDASDSLHSSPVSKRPRTAVIIFYCFFLWRPLTVEAPGNCPVCPPPPVKSGPANYSQKLAELELVPALRGRRSKLD